MAPTSMKEELQQFWSQQKGSTIGAEARVSQGEKSSSVSESVPKSSKSEGHTQSDLGAASKLLNMHSIATPCRRVGKARGESNDEDKTVAPHGVNRKRKARWDELPPSLEVGKVSLSSKSSIRPQSGGWDKTTAVEPTARPAGSREMAVLARKRREVYVGNLQLGQVSCELIQKTFRKLFEKLPEFVERYPDVHEPVRSVLIPTNSTGMFAFVELFDEVLANTAIFMSGFELAGRSVKVGRPVNYETPPEGEKCSLCVEPLRKLGLIPDLGSSDPQTLLARELYFGNINADHVTAETLVALLTPACEQCPSFDRSKGPAISDIKMATTNFYCFVQFQQAEMATVMLEIFEDVEFCGRILRVRRPSNYYTALEACGLLPPVQKSLPAPPPPAVLQPPVMPPPPAVLPSLRSDNAHDFDVPPPPPLRQVEPPIMIPPPLPPTMIPPSQPPVMIPPPLPAHLELLHGKVASSPTPLPQAHSELSHGAIVHAPPPPPLPVYPHPEASLANVPPPPVPVHGVSVGIAL